MNERAVLSYSGTNHISELPEDMKSKVRNLENLEFYGNHMVLDFINTLDHRGTERERDWFNDYHDILAWSYVTRFASKQETRTRALLAAENPENGTAAFSLLIEIRELLYRIIAVRAVAGEAVEDDWQRFNSILQQTLLRAELVPTPAATECCTWRFNTAPEDLLWLRPPLIKAAADLLVAEKEGRLKQCATQTCCRLFYDTSKNNGRRWCEPGCGNRTKVRRAYYKKKAAGM